MTNTWNIGDKVKVPYPGRCYPSLRVIFEELGFKDTNRNPPGDYYKVKDQVWEIFAFSHKKISLCGVRSLTTGQELLVEARDLSLFNSCAIPCSIEDLIEITNQELIN